MGKDQVAALTSAERGALITIVVCMNAAGTFVPPLVIFPRKNMSDQLKKGAPPGTIFAVHPSGWIQANLFTMWFQHFVAFVKPTKVKPVLLILDGHFSHTQNIDLIDLARQNHVAIVSLPPHSSHKMQPLDRTFMGPLKAMYSEEIRQWLRHSDRPVGAYEVMELFGKAYIKCQKAEIAINGFRVTGIYPIDRNRFTESEYIEEANKKQEPALKPNSSRGQEVEEEIDPETIAEYNSSEQVNVEIDLNKPSTSRASQNAIPSTSSGTSQVSLTPLQKKPSKPSSSEKEETSQGKAFQTSPFQINPIPKIKKRASTRGRTACSSAIITSSPYKSELEQAKDCLLYTSRCV